MNKSLERLKQYEKLKEKGLNNREIGEMFGVTRQAVAYTLSNSAKIRTRKELECNILKDIQKGLRTKIIASKYNVTYGTIYNIKKRWSNG